MANYTTDLCINASNAIESGHFLDREASKAFDNAAATIWDVQRTGTDRWVGYNFSTDQYINKIRIQSPNNIEVMIGSGYDYTLEDFHIDGWDGTAWELIEAYIGEAQWSDSEWREYILAPTREYSQYRIFVDKVTVEDLYPTNYGLAIAEIEMMRDLDYVYIPPDPVGVSEIYHTKAIRGKAAEGFIRPTIAQFFTSKDFKEILNT